MRPYLLFVSGIVGVVGLSRFADFSPLMGTVLFASFFLSYGFGQALTDCFQTDTDALSSPYRPLVQGTVRREHVLVVSVVGLGLTVAVMFAANPATLPLSTAGFLGLLTYTFFKRRWWAGPFYNAWIVGVLYLVAVLDGSPGSGLEAVVDPVVFVTLAAVFFGYANFVLTGYFKDVSADRATGYETFPVRYGLRLSAYVSDVFASVSLIATGTAAWVVLDPGGAVHAFAAALAFGIAALLSSVTAQTRLHRVSDESEAHRAINPVVHTYILQLSALTVALRPGWALGLTLFYFAFWVVMRTRPAAQQI